MEFFKEIENSQVEHLKKCGAIQIKRPCDKRLYGKDYFCGTKTKCPNFERHLAQSKQSN